MSRSLIGVDEGAFRGVVIDKATEGVGVRAVNDGGSDVAGEALPNANHRSLANRAATSAQLLRSVLVLLLPAEVGLVRLHRSVKRRAGVVHKGLPNAMREIPSRLLRHPEVPVEPHHSPLSWHASCSPLLG